jgi:hypothetical protein
MLPRPAEGKHLIPAVNSPFPRPEIVHVASPESTAADGVGCDGASATVDTAAVTSEAARTREWQGAGTFR